MQADFLKQKLDQTKDMVLNRILIVLLFFMILGLSISLLRVKATGFLFIYGVQISLAVLMVVLFIFQKKLSTMLKGGIFLTALYGMGLSSIFSFGLYGFGWAYFIPASAIAYLYFSHRTGWIITASSFMVLIACAILFTKGFLHFTPQNPTYMETVPMWMNMIITVLLIATVITMFWNNLYNLLNNTFTHIYHQQNDMQKMNAQLIAARDQAMKSDQLKSSFLQNISHEIRTPLNIIIGFSEMVAQTTDPNEQLEFNRVIRENSNSMLKVVNDIVDFSKIETNSLALNPSKFNVKEVLDQLEKKFAMKHSEQLQFEIDKIDAQVETDKERLNQILCNLLDNAFKFTPEGKVELRCQRNASHLHFRINDTGIGIAPEEQEKIFERFYRVNPFAGGAGLGLSISKSIAKFMGGDIVVKSEPQKGSSFEFTLPYLN